MRTRSTIGFLAMLIGIFLVNIASTQDVKITSATPNGAVENLNQAQSILVVFNQPMLALTALPDSEGTGPLEITPPVKGRFRWLGTSVLEFTPAERFKNATAFDVRIAAGLTALSGNMLQKDFLWRFETPRPRILRHNPEQNAKNQTLRPVISLVFNQAISPEQTSSFFNLAESKSTQSIAITVENPNENSEWNSYEDDPKENVILIRPVGDLRIGTSYTLRVNAALMGKEGPLPMGSLFELQFRTFEKFIFNGIEQTNAISPNDGLKFQFSNPVAREQFFSNVSFHPPIKDLAEAYGYYSGWEKKFCLSLDLLPDTTYVCSISADLQDIFGNRLGQKSVITITTSDYPPRWSIDTGEAVLEAYGERRFPANFVNQKSIHLKMGILAPEKLIPLLQSQQAFETDTPLADSLFSLHKDWQINSKRNKPILLPIEADWVTVGAKYGLLLMQMQPADPYWEGKDFKKALLQITDLGITAKFSAMNNLVWVTRLQDATPVANVNVEIRDDENKVLWIGVTDQNGMAVTPGWKKMGLSARNEWTAPRQWVFVRNGRDFAYTASDRGTGIEPYRFGISYKWNIEPSLTLGFLFTERGIYRAGETVHIKGIFRHRPFEEWQVWPKKKINLKIVDARNEELLNSQVRLSEMGSFSYDLDLKDTAPLGYYWVNAETLKVTGTDTSFTSIGSCSFQVESYRPAEFEVEVRAGQNEYIPGDTLRANITARYLFGALMPEAPVSWRVHLSEQYFEPRADAGYFWGPQFWLLDEERPYYFQQLATGEDSLDLQANLAIKVPITSPDLLMPGNIMIEGEVASPSRQYIAGRRNIPIHPGEFYLGIKPSSTFMNVKEKLRYEVVSAAPNGDFLAQKQITVKIYRQVWHSVRKAGIDGRYEWISRAVNSLQDSVQLTTSIPAVEQTFQPDSSGFYFIEAKGQDARGNRLLAHAYFYATGAGYVAWERSNDDLIELVKDKSLYKPGDHAQIMIKSPFENATALVTVEREGILHKFVARLSGSAPKIDIPIEETYLPNAFIGVVLLQGRIGNQMFSDEGEDIGRPAFKVGYIDLPVVKNSRHLEVLVKTAASEYQPGQPVEVTLSLKNASGQPVAGEITLAAVDVGVLNLIGYQMPDPLDFFYGERMLGVLTSETRLHVVEQRNYGEKGENRGGGGGFGLAGVDLRRKFVATAYWNPVIQVDQSGVASVRFNLPDNLTTFRIMAVAHTVNSHFGYGKTDIKVNKPVLLQASLPRFARYGDQFEAGVVVHNFSGSDGSVQLQVEVDGLKLKSNPNQTLAIANGKAREIRFPFQVDRIGKARFRFRAVMGTLSDGLEVTIPLQHHRVKETVANFQSSENSVKEKIIIPKNIYADLGNIEFVASATAMSDLRGSMDYLFNYPYGCLEQQLAQILPIIQSEELVLAFKLPTLKGADYRQVVQQTLAEVAKFQRSDGGFSAWTDGNYSWPYLSAFTIYTLIQARDKGYTIDEKSFQAAIAYLKKNLHFESETQYPYGLATDWVIKCFILYDLTLLKEPDYGYLARAFENRLKIPLQGRIFLLKALHYSGKQNQQVEALIAELSNNLKIDPTTAYFDEPLHNDLRWIYYSNVRTTASLLQAVLEVRDQHPMAERMVRWLLLQRKNNSWQNTQDNYYALYALTTYFKKYEAAEPNFQTEFKLSGKKVLEAAFAGRTLETSRQISELGRFDSGKPLELAIEKKGPGRIYYGTWMTYFPQDPVPSRSAGITVAKTIQPASRKSDGTGKYLPGEMVRVTLQFLLPHDRQFLVVDDPLPGGFEPINLRLQTESQAGQQLLDAASENPWYGFNHVEMHDDRVLLFADYLPAGEYQFEYLARATTYGQFTMPPTQVEEMYTPEVFGRYEGRRIQIGK